MDKNYFKLRELKPSDVFVYVPDGSRHYAYAYIEKELDSRNYVILTFPYIRTIIRNKMGKGKELHRPSQDNIEDGYRTIIYRIFNEVSYGKKYFDFLKGK